MHFVGTMPRGKGRGRGGIGRGRGEGGRGRGSPIRDSNDVQINEHSVATTSPPQLGRGRGSPSRDSQPSLDDEVYEAPNLRANLPTLAPNGKT